MDELNDASITVKTFSEKVTNEEISYSSNNKGEFFSTILKTPEYSTGAIWFFTDETFKPEDVSSAIYKYPTEKEIVNPMDGVIVDITPLNVINPPDAPYDDFFTKGSGLKLVVEHKVEDYKVRVIYEYMSMLNDSIKKQGPDIEKADSIGKYLYDPNVIHVGKTLPKGTVLGKTGKTGSTPDKANTYVRITMQKVIENDNKEQEFEDYKIKKFFGNKVNK